MGLNRKIRASTRTAGLIFIPTLFALLVITSLVTLLLQRGKTISSTEVAIKEGELLDKKLRSQLTSQSGGPTRCVGGSDASPSKDLFVCREDPLPLLSYPALNLPEGIPDLHSIDRSFSSCPETPVAVGRSRFVAPTSAHTCTLDSVTIHKTLALRENIRVNTLGINATRVLLVASLGSISVESVVLEGGDLLVFAAGEITVSSLANNADKPSKITILSARGDIEVAATSGNLSLLLLGRSRLKAPPTLLTPPFPLPDLRRPALLGVIPVNRLP